MDHVLYQILKTILNIYLKYETVADNLSIMIYENKIQNRITLKIKAGYYL